MQRAREGHERLTSNLRLGVLPGGAKGTRTPDPLLANRRQDIHHCTYVQVSVPGCAYQFSGILAGCCTFLLYWSALTGTRIVGAWLVQASAQYRGRRLCRVRGGARWLRIHFPRVDPGLAFRSLPVHPGPSLQTAYSSVTASSPAVSGVFARATCRWALDSGGFTELSPHGRWQAGPRRADGLDVRAVHDRTDGPVSLGAPAPHRRQLPPPARARTHPAVHPRAARLASGRPPAPDYRWAASGGTRLTRRRLVHFLRELPR
jgi:hypothetical protein